MQFSMKIDGFEQKYSQGFENSYNSYELTIPIREIFHFHHLPKLYFGFNTCQIYIKLCSKYVKMTLECQIFVWKAQSY